MAKPEMVLVIPGDKGVKSVSSVWIQTAVAAFQMHPVRTIKRSQGQAGVKGQALPPASTVSNTEQPRCDVCGQALPPASTVSSTEQPRCDGCGVGCHTAVVGYGGDGRVRRCGGHRHDGVHARHLLRPCVFPITPTSARTITQASLCAVNGR